MANYFGSGADGNLTVSSDTELTAVEDGQYLVKNYDTLVIDAGYKLTTDVRCKGLFLYVKGDCTINGELSMSLRGASADPVADGVSATGIRLRMEKSGDTESLANPDFAGCGANIISAVANQSGISSNGVIMEIVRTGGTGGTGGNGNSSTEDDGDTGGTIANGLGGGGGGGSSRYGATAGTGGIATCFSGGPGGGGTTDPDGGNYSSTAKGSDTGGAGGPAKGSSSNHTAYGSTGGNGNPGGAGYSGGSAGQDGTGGVIWLIVGGDLTFGASAVVSADGIGGTVSVGGGTYSVGIGGASGGGAVKIAYAGSLTDNGVDISVDGGIIADFPTEIDGRGGAGGAGTYEILQVDAGPSGAVFKGRAIIAV